MCEKEPKRRSCTECPQYDGMKCTATDFTLGDRDEVLYQEHRRGFICLDTGEAELKGDAVLQWTAAQERLCQEKGYKSVEEMWDAEGKQVKSGFHINEDNKELEPMLQVSNESASTAGSPSSECPSLREGPPQKGKIDDHNALRLEILRHPEATCLNCNKSHREGLRLVCDKWGLQDILMPQRTCKKWDLNLIFGRAEGQQIHYVVGSGLQYVENPPPLFRDLNGFWEPVRPRSCTNCKLYNDPICMKIGTHIGNRAQIWNREDLNGFQCIAALPKEERDKVITSIGCNNRKEIL